MVFSEEVYGVSGRSLWCFRKKSMVIRIEKPHKQAIFRVSKSRRKSREKSREKSSYLSRGAPRQFVKKSMSFKQVHGAAFWKKPPIPPQKLCQLRQLGGQRERELARSLAVKRNPWSARQGFGVVFSPFGRKSPPPASPPLTVSPAPGIPISRSGIH